MHQELIYLVDDISYDIQADEKQVTLKAWGKTSSTGWQDASLSISGYDKEQNILFVEFKGSPPNEHKGVHDDTTPVLTDVYAEAFLDTNEISDPIFSVTVKSKTNEINKGIADENV